MASGIDTAVMSTHKVLASFTQAAVLHQQGSLVDDDRLRTTVGMVQTTSPSVSILASIDATRRQMALSGEILLDRTIALAVQARERLQAIAGVSVLDGPSLGLSSIDLTKLVVDVNGLGITGYEAEDRLRHVYGIGPEMSDLVALMFLITIGDTQVSIDRLVAGFEGLARESSAAVSYTAMMRSSGAPVAPATLIMTPHEAFFAPAHAVPLAESVGAVSAELVIPYPPGIPVLAPGEVIMPEKVDYLREGASQGMYLSGPADSTLTTIRVVS
jgi:arginine/lysine/ornithine decarboxylase